MTPLWTSSGPSASRSTRAWAKKLVSGVSSDTPAPPWIWIALSTIFCSMLGATTLIAEISVIAPSAPTWSSFHAAYSVSSRAWSIASRASATRSRLPPRSISGLPNAMRDIPRWIIRSSACSAAPMQRMQWWSRPGPEPAVCYLDAHARPGDDVAARHADIVEHDLAVAVRRVERAEHRQHALDLHARGVEWHQHLRVLVVAVGGLRGCVGHEDRDLAARVADPARPPLPAVEHDVVTLDDRGRPQVGRARRRDLGLVHPDHRADLAGEQRLEPALLLLVGAVPPQHL